MYFHLTIVVIALLTLNMVGGIPQHHHDKHHQLEHNCIENANLDNDNTTDNAPKEEVRVIEEEIDEYKISENTEAIETTVLPEAEKILSPDTAATKQRECVCALFTTRSEIQTDAPIMSKVFNDLSDEYDLSAEDVCTDFCISYAASRYSQRDAMICSRLINVSDLTVYVHAKENSETALWSFTGLQNPKPLCCDNSVPTDCKSKITEMIVP